MPWEYILSGASGGAIIGIFIIIFIKKIIEKNIDNEFDKKLEEYKNDLNKLLESHKTDLTITSTIRIELLKDTWLLHKNLLAGIYSIIKELSEDLSLNNKLFDELINNKNQKKEIIDNLKDRILILRKTIISNAFLISEEQTFILYRFINISKSFCEMLENNIDKKYLPEENKIIEIWDYYYSYFMKVNENSPIQNIDKNTLIEALIEDMDDRFIYHTKIGELKIIRNEYLKSVSKQFNISDILP